VHACKKWKDANLFQDDRGGNEESAHQVASGAEDGKPLAREQETQVSQAVCEGLVHLKGANPCFGRAG
jgi:cation transport regulator ChaB